MDTVGVRAGCTLTAYSDSSFNGDRIDIKATSIDRQEKENLILLLKLKSDLDGLCLLTMQSTNTWTAILSPSDVFADISSSGHIL